jgi:hypothetical protein
MTIMPAGGSGLEIRQSGIERYPCAGLTGAVYKETSG